MEGLKDIRPLGNGTQEVAAVLWWPQPLPLHFQLPRDQPPRITPGQKEPATTQIVLQPL